MHNDGYHANSKGKNISMGKSFPKRDGFFFLRFYVALTIVQGFFFFW